MARIPHFDYPFRLTAQGHPVVVEQDAIEEIESCLAVILITEEGQRIELPEFGIESLLFKRQPVPVDDIYNAITDQEPRAAVVLSQQPDPLDYLTALVEVDVKAQNPPIGDS
jgi:hypothetical protein